MNPSKYSFSSSSQAFLLIMLLGMGSSLLLFSSASAHRPKPPKYDRNKCVFYRPAVTGGGMHHRVKRIANGTEGDIRAMPWMVFVSTLTLSSTGNRHSNCTGSLVSRRHVLTAAHCLPVHLMPNSSYTITVYYGSTDKNTARSIVLPKSAAHRHPNMTTFRPPNSTLFSITLNDVGIVDLGQDLKLDDTVQPICVACLNNNTFPKGQAIIAGWGNINSPTCSGLLPILPDIFYSQYVGVHQCLTAAYKSADKVCTQLDPTHGIGGGDSGGPALASYNNGRNFLQVGVNGQKNCRVEEREDAANKVDKQWFEQITGIKCKNFLEEE